MHVADEPQVGEVRQQGRRRRARVQALAVGERARAVDGVDLRDDCWEWRADRQATRCRQRRTARIHGEEGRGRGGGRTLGGDLADGEERPVVAVGRLERQERRQEERAR